MKSLFEKLSKENQETVVKQSEIYPSYIGKVMADLKKTYYVQNLTLSSFCYLYDNFISHGSIQGELGIFLDK